MASIEGPNNFGQNSCNRIEMNHKGDRKQVSDHFEESCVQWIAMANHSWIASNEYTQRCCDGILLPAPRTDSESFCLSWHTSIIKHSLCSGPSWTQGLDNGWL